MSVATPAAAATKGPAMKITKKTPEAATAQSEAVTTANTLPAADTTDAESLTKAPVDLIQDTVHEIENVKEQKAFTLVPQLLNDIDHDYFRLGGYLSKIQNEGWFMEKGYETFKSYVESDCGIQYRKAMYLIQIYNGLVASGVSWADVKHLGWTKLKELAAILTPDNVGEWAALAENMTVMALQEHIKASTAAPNSDGPIADDSAAQAVTTMTFKVHADQKTTVREALDKAKHEVGTEFDAVALEAIAMNYLGGESKIKNLPTLAELMKGKSAEEVLGIFGDIFPEVELSASL